MAPNGKSSLVVSESFIKLGSNVLTAQSNLPLMIVETFGDGVPGVGTTFGDMFIGLIEPGDDGSSQLTDQFDLQTCAGMHVRGSSSAGFSKKQYRVEFWDERNEDQQHEVLGMPAEADWIFYGPGPYDRVLISNPLMFDLSNQIGRYATRTQYVEMYLNADGGELNSYDYVGLYAIMEVVERGDDRVDVEPLTTGAGGVPVSGGFVWKNDRGSAYVDPEAPTTAQRQYIDGWLNQLAAAAAGPNFKDPNLGYAHYADVDSFVDHNILNLLSMNVDALRLSSYYYKTADGKLEAGPIWDFDRSLESTDGRDDNPRSWFGTGDSTRYFDDDDRVRSWWPDMFQDPDFVQRYIDRWFQLRQNEFSLSNLNATIDAHAAQITAAAARLRTLVRFAVHEFRRRSPASEGLAQESRRMDRLQVAGGADLQPDDTPGRARNAGLPGGRNRPGLLHARRQRPAGRRRSDSAGRAIGDRPDPDQRFYADHGARLQTGTRHAQRLCGKPATIGRRPPWVSSTTILLPQPVTWPSPKCTITLAIRRPPSARRISRCGRF